MGAPGLAATWSLTLLSPLPLMRGAASFAVHFRYVVFHPFLDEILIGTIKGCSPEGVHGKGGVAARGLQGQVACAICRVAGRHCCQGQPSPGWPWGPVGACGVEVLASPLQAASLLGALSWAAQGAGDSRAVGSGLGRDSPASWSPTPCRPIVFQSLSASSMKSSSPRSHCSSQPSCILPRWRTCGPLRPH